jgi:hypothetical protein
MAPLPALGGGLGAWHRRFVSLFVRPTSCPLPGGSGDVSSLPSLSPVNSASGPPARFLSSDSLHSVDPARPPPLVVLSWGAVCRDACALQFDQFELEHFSFLCTSHFISVPRCCRLALCDEHTIRFASEDSDALFFLRFPVPLFRLLPRPADPRRPRWCGPARLRYLQRPQMDVLYFPGPDDPPPTRRRP